MAHTPKYDANRYKPVPKPSAARTALLAKLAARTAKKRVPVTVDLGDGETLALEAGRPSAGAKWKIQQDGFLPAESEDGKSVMVPVRFFPGLIGATMYVPGTDELMWPEGEEGAIAALDSSITDQLIGPALTALGDTKEVEEDISKNSEAATAAISGT